MSQRPRAREAGRVVGAEHEYGEEHRLVDVQMCERPSPRPELAEDVEGAATLVAIYASSAARRRISARAIDFTPGNVGLCSSAM